MTCVHMYIIHMHIKAYNYNSCQQCCHGKSVLSDPDSKVACSPDKGPLSVQETNGTVYIYVPGLYIYSRSSAKSIYILTL